jgi:hypothetical protein
LLNIHGQSNGRSTSRDVEWKNLVLRIRESDEGSERRADDKSSAKLLLWFWGNQIDVEMKWSDSVGHV